MSAAGLAVAFTAGIFSFLSPCIVPMLSVYFSLITGQSFRNLRDFTPAEALRAGVLKQTGAFIVGFTLVFTAAGALAGQAGALLGKGLWLLNLVGGGLVVLLGLMMLGVVPAVLLQRLTLRHRDPDGRTGEPSVWSSFLVGLVFAVACSHCIAPTLYSVLLYAGSTGSPAVGAGLMFAFSLGLAVPYLLAGLFLGRMVGWLRRADSSRLWVQRTAGLLTVALGLVMMAGKLTVLTGWASRIWPWRLPLGM